MEVPWVGANGGEAELPVVWIHLLDLFSGWRAEELDDLDQLIDAWETNPTDPRRPIKRDHCKVST
jgi:hypothetical protein